MGRPRKFSDEDKARAVSLVEVSKKSRAEVGREFGVAASLVGKWVVASRGRARAGDLESEAVRRAGEPIDLLVEMRWCLDNPGVETRLPIRKQLRALLKKDVGKFLDRYTALVKASGVGVEVKKAEVDEGSARVLALIDRLLSEWGRDGEKVLVEKAQVV